MVSGPLNTGVIVEAKNEYTKQLTNLLKPLIYEALIVLYSAAVEQCDSMDTILDVYHGELSNIPKWNNEVIKKETERIKESCVYFDDLITAVIISNVKILSSVKVGKSKKKTKIAVPSATTFVHSVYIAVSKELLSDLEVFDIERFSGRITNNVRLVYLIIEKSIEDAIRSLLPLQSILEASFTRYAASDNSDNESVDEPEPEPFQPEPFVQEEQVEPVDYASDHEGSPLASPRTENPECHEPTCMETIVGPCSDDEQEEVKEVKIDTLKQKKPSFFDGK